MKKLITGAARARSRRRRRGGAALVVALLLALLLALLGGSIAQGAQRTKLVRYRGVSLLVPAAWPVYDLARDPHVCVRFDRHAVYLGKPGSQESCPPSLIGRTEAILVAPVSPALFAPPAPTSVRADAAGGSEAVLQVGGVQVTATWRSDPATIRRALRAASLAPLAAAARRRSLARPRVIPPRQPHASMQRQVRRAGSQSPPAIAGQIYTGLGFDACMAPTTTQMAAWDASPYHAVGIYVGGTNEGCSQPNLNSTWTSLEATDGWHLIPIYVGLQAPRNSCGCAPIVPASAAAEGAAAAADAVTQAQALGIGTGNPIFDDMEGYTHTASNTTAVLAFLDAWTTTLHAEGYMSGIYSSSDSGIADLSAQLANPSFHEPDDLWIANWNGQQATTDPNVPATAWPDHQRLHQYSGGGNETYGGVRLNVDDNYIDSATAAPGATQPKLSIAPANDGSIALLPAWPFGPQVSEWQVLAGPSPTALVPTGDVGTPGAPGGIVVHSAFPYFEVQALDASGTALAASPPVATPAHLSLFGGTVFVSAQGGFDAFPVGCFNAVPCHVSARVSIGRRMLVQTGHEYVPVGGGMLYFAPNATVRRLVQKAAKHRVAVTISLTDTGSGLRTSKAVVLKGFSTTGPGPKRIINSQSPSVQLLGLTDFVSNGWVGGVLAECTSPTPCSVSTTITIGKLVIAQSRPAYLGVGELGYMLFTLTKTGHRLLTQAKGNQLLARATLRNGSDLATGRVALVSFS
ncbi:MAG TPA: DUF1906 domain-containing protein [Solirubrobacteraceae bacterium]|nr:DUF1906 domain-containing protein [Solirubrobacteraceae bacterium]